MQLIVKNFSILPWKIRSYRAYSKPDQFKSTNFIGGQVLLASAKEQHALKNVNNCWNTNVSFSLATSGGQNCNLYFNAAHFFNTGVN